MFSSKNKAVRGLPATWFLATNKHFESKSHDVAFRKILSAMWKMTHPFILRLTVPWISSITDSPSGPPPPQCPPQVHSPERLLWGKFIIYLLSANNQTCPFVTLITSFVSFITCRKRAAVGNPRAYCWRIMRLPSKIREPSLKRDFELIRKNSIFFIRFRCINLRRNYKQTIVVRLQKTTLLLFSMPSCIRQFLQIQISFN